MSKSDLIYLDHILQSLRKIIDYLDGVEYEFFLMEEQKQDAVIRKIEVVGEATKKISQKVRNRLVQPGLNERKGSKFYFERGEKRRRCRSIGEAF